MVKKVVKKMVNCNLCNNWHVYDKKCSEGLESYPKSCEKYSENKMRAGFLYKAILDNKSKRID